MAEGNYVVEGDKCPDCGEGIIEAIPHNPFRMKCDNCGAEYNDKGMRVPCQSASTRFG